MQTEKPRAKAKVRIGHRAAIQQYEQWLAGNPKATQRKRMKMFDHFVDKNAP